MKTATAPRHIMLRLPRNCKTQKHKVLPLPPGNDTLRLTRFPSTAPATQNAHATSQLERLKHQKKHFVRDFLHFSHFEGENRRFRPSFSYKAIFTELQKYDFLRRFRHFSSTSQNAVPATTFNTLSRLRSPDIAIHHNSHCATSQNAAPVTKSKTHKRKVLRLPRKNDTVTLTRFQSIAHATQHANTIPRNIAKHHKTTLFAKKSNSGR